MEAGDLFRIIYFAVIVLVFFGSIIRNIIKSLGGKSEQAKNEGKTDGGGLEELWDKVLATNKAEENVASTEVNNESDDWRKQRTLREREDKRQKRQREFSKIKSRHEDETNQFEKQMPQKTSKYASKSFAKLFKDKNQVKQAFIMSEIFKRKY